MEREKRDFKINKSFLSNFFNEIITYLPQLVEYILFSKDKDKNLKEITFKIHNLEKRLDLLEKEIKSLKMYNEEISKRIKLIFNLFIIILLLIIFILCLIALKIL